VAEVFYRRLLNVVDDFGRFDGRVRILSAQCFPTLLEIVRESDVSRLLAACEKAGLIRLYQVDSYSYLEVLNFRQFTRAKSSKYPAPGADAMHMQCRCSADAVQMHSLYGDGGATPLMSVPASPDPDTDPSTEPLFSHPSEIPATPTGAHGSNAGASEWVDPTQDTPQPKIAPQNASGEDSTKGNKAAQKTTREGKPPTYSEAFLAFWARVPARVT
jgi:hypothetical protein